MTVFPEQSEIKDVAKLLLQLADHPRDVATTLDPTMGFRIPYWLYKLFVEVWDGRSASIVSTDASADITEAAKRNPTIVESVPRKPGRPRKEVK